MSKPTVILAGKLPPPYIGPSVATKLLLESRLNDEFDLVHLDLSDHRDINTLGAVDVQNVALALKHYADLARLVRRHRPALVYMPGGQTTISYGRDAGFVLVAKALGCKVLCHLRGGNFKNWYRGASAATQLMVRRVHALVDGQIVLGENLRHLFAGLVPDDRIFVVPNGGDYPAVSPNGQAKPEGTFRVLYLSNFQGTKGILEVLRAAPAVVARHPDVEFVFAGNWRDDETRRQFEQFVREHPDLPVRVAGPVKGEEKFRLFASSDVLALPTYYPNEGHPWVIVEAMRYGLPIISTAHAAIPESVADGVNGFLVPQRDPGPVADRIVDLIEDPERRERMGEASRRRYEEDFTEARMIERLGDAFWSVIRRPPRTQEARAQLTP